MTAVFLAHSFQPVDRDLVFQVQRLLESHSLRVLTGRRAGGAEITPEVKRLIAGAVGVVALLTQREEKTAGGWTTHDWVQYELNHARDTGKQAIALVEDGVDLSSVYGSHERLEYNRADPLPAFLALSETIKIWKDTVGRQGKIRIHPDDVARRLGSGARLKYRLGHNGRYSEWQQADQPVPEPGGIFLYVNGILDDILLQVEMEDGADKWTSIATPPWIWVELSKPPR